MWAVTGIYFAFPGPFLQGVDFLMPLHLFREDGPLPRPSEGNQLLDIDVLVSKAEAATPGRVTTWIGIPREDNPQARIDRSASLLDDSHDVTYVLINAVSGEIERIESPDKRSLGDMVLLWFSYLHFGNFGGLPIKVTWVMLGLSLEDGEEVIQEVFLSLFQHLRQGKPRQNLRGWVFRVGHNLALKRRYPGSQFLEQPEEGAFDRLLDPALDPEEALAARRKQERLLGVVRALPEQDRCCLNLRAEGLRYREIAQVLGMSLGSVALSLGRSIERLSRANRS
jgi:RNA polymerase sigma-70 factor (ECF subfamily)